MGDAQSSGEGAVDAVCAPVAEGADVAIVGFPEPFHMADGGAVGDDQGGMGRKVLGEEPGGFAFRMFGLIEALVDRFPGVLFGVIPLI